MACQDPTQSPHTPNTTLAACVCSANNPKVTPLKIDPPIPIWSPTIREFPVTLGSNVEPCVPGGIMNTSATGESHLEEVQVTLSSSLTQSCKSRISLGPMCRICHEEEAAGTLLRPCWCSGSVAAVHQVCLERWLNLATSDKCELCGYSFHLRYTTRPFWEFMIKCHSSEARRAFKVDLICLLVLTPVAALSVYLCSLGAIEYYTGHKSGLPFVFTTENPNRFRPGRGRFQEDDVPAPVQSESSEWEGLALVAGAVLFFLIYTFWVVLTLKYHARLWRHWKVVHQNVTLACTLSPLPSASPTSHTPPAGSDLETSPSSTNPVHLHDTLYSRLVVSS